MSTPSFDMAALAESYRAARIAADDRAAYADARVRTLERENAELKNLVVLYRPVADQSVAGGTGS